MQKQIAIQGIQGCFHEEAARHFFDDPHESIAVINCTNFRELIKTTQHRKECHAGIMAIENSIAGSILPNYNLLQKSDLVITGEIYLHIRQHLLVNPGVVLDDIREVHSHPMALQQCLDFLDKHPWKLVESDDTASSAKNIQKGRSKHIAAIAGKLAAELYGLEILVPNIQTMKKNYTRFLVLEKKECSVPIGNANKASIQFHTNHTRGSLASVLKKIATHDINLSKLQSMPIPGTEWKYSFHADMEFERPVQLKKALAAIQPLTEEIRVYGIYQKGKTV